MNPILDDFRNFLYIVWDTLGLPEPASYQYDIAKFVQHGPSRSIITAQRGAGKSYITSAFAVWNLMRDPNMKILVVSMNQTRAAEFVILAKQIILNTPVCSHLIPRLDQRNGAFRFDVGAQTVPAKDPSVTAYGVSSQIIGAHVDLIVPDDIESMDNSATVEMRDKIHHKCLDFENILNPGGKIVYLGTPHTEDSLYNKLTSSGYSRVLWPGEYPNPDDDDACANVSEHLLERLFDPEDKEAVSGAPTYPERFPEELLIEKKALMGPTMYAMQVLLRTDLADEERYPLKQRDFIVMPVHGDIAPVNVVWGTTKSIDDIPSVGFGRDHFYRPIFWDDDYQNYTGKMMFIDPAGHGKDETGYCVSFFLNGLVFIPECGGLDGGYSEATLKKLSEIAYKWGVRKVVIEKNFGDGMYSQLLSPIMAAINGPTGIEEVHSVGMKEMRICDKVESPLSGHRIIIDPSVAKDKVLMYQLTHICRIRGALRHDDRIEALAGAISHWTENMALDAGVMADRMRDNLKKQCYMEFIDTWKRTANSRAVVSGFLGPTEQKVQSKTWGRTPWSRKNRVKIGGRS